jgi:hypothetical protein
MLTRRRRWTGRLLCMAVVVFLAHVYCGCGQPVADDCGPSISAAGDDSSTFRHDPRTCPVCRALQTLTAANPLVVRAAVLSRDSGTVWPAVSPVATTRMACATSARGPPLDLP